MVHKKPELIIDLDKVNVEPCFRAQSALAVLKTGASFHDKHDCRHPLGIYNVSFTRILRKICSCSEKLEALHRRVSSLQDLEAARGLREEMIDYLELCLYAAAEHVDDINAIALCFFASSAACDKSKLVRRLKDDLKPIRDRISAVTNAIKHKHSRIRLLSMDLKEQGVPVCLHGFFVERFQNGGVGPAILSRSSGEQTLSITSFLWSIICYLFLASERLASFLTELKVQDGALAVGAIDNSLVHKSAVALARLPLYAFDESNPFEKARVVIRGGVQGQRLLDSGIHGSILRRWNRTLVPEFGKSRMDYEGDGTTRQFDIAHPKTLKLCHWD